ncbi:ABC transporter permease [Aureimonas phyllosphaerae]|uniref:Transport permease protein n=1 Tax=Aureimonas phyllosphaerae TaxID=1166078 RepID=A0A7W6BVG7_9HYPH|nr:ABC transporter permease [Aureimonas phyllosphaerae]MBB3935470.1 ABC-2 type transport system permease protein/lipopolysaccharide transport system permease protein [Aureimonas phyllosphaerae]MBB3959478.1 ABC-2 type transport system permease protein/lipopolysaccharide transport system permease protein [Aureimonas phyllosphaerae]
MKAATSARTWVTDGHQDRAAMLRAAGADFLAGLRMHELWLFLGWRDVQKHYSRSVLGPLWLTLSMGVMVAGLGVLYSQIFRQDISSYLPFLAIGFIMWGLISGLITGACDIYSSAAASVRQVRMPLSVYVFQFVWRQLLTFGHNFVIYILVAIIFGIWPGMTGLLFFPALLILILNGVFAGMILGPLCARFRDIPLIIASVVQVVFFMTPILWSSHMLPDRAVLLAINPFYHLIEILRDPLLGQPALLQNWLACIGLTILMGTIAVLFFARFRARIAYWA